MEMESLRYFYLSNDKWREIGATADTKQWKQFNSDKDVDSGPACVECELEMPLGLRPTAPVVLSFSQILAIKVDFIARERQATTCVGTLDSET